MSTTAPSCHRPSQQTRLPQFRSTLQLALLAGLFAAACSAPAPTPGGRVESRDLGLAIGTLPRGVVVATNQGTTLQLTGSTEKGPGQLTVTVGPPETSINLVETVKQQRATFEALPRGQYFGYRELVTPSGSAFTVRGRFEEGGEEVEEVRVLALHPAKDRRLSLSYRYPAGGDTEERMNQLLEVLGEIEAFPAATTTGDAATP